MDTDSVFLSLDSDLILIIIIFLFDFRIFIVFICHHAYW